MPGTKSWRSLTPTRLNAITDEDTIGYDLAEMDNAESHLKRIRDLHLPVDELAAYNSMAVYLRWAMERGQMSNPFLTQYRNVVEAVRAGNGPDLRVFIRDKLDGKLSTQFFRSGRLWLCSMVCPGQSLKPLWLSSGLP